MDELKKINWKALCVKKLNDEDISNLYQELLPLRNYANDIKHRLPILPSKQKKSMSIGVLDQKTNPNTTLGFSFDLSSLLSTDNLQHQTITIDTLMNILFAADSAIANYIEMETKKWLD